MAEGMSKRELKQLRRLEKLEKAKLEQSQNKNKTLIFAVAGFLFVAFFAALIVFTKESKKDTANTQLADAPISFTQEGAAKGPETAPVTLVEFGDYQCPACAAYHPVVEEVLERYPNDVRLLFKHFPISSIHPFAVDAGLAAEAAGVQGKYFEMHDLIYTRQNEWTQDPQGSFESYAAELGLDVDQFKADMERGDLKDKIEAQRVEGIEVGVNSTPTFFLNGVKIQNPQDADGFAVLIDEALRNGREAVGEVDQNNEATDSASGDTQQEQEGAVQVAPEINE